MALSLFTRWWNRREAFRATMQRDEWLDVNDSLTPQASRVLVELREFCRANETCVVVGKDGHIDTHATILAEGRREVWLRIQSLLNLSDEALFKLRNPDEE